MTQEVFGKVGIVVHSAVSLTQKRGDIVPQGSEYSEWAMGKAEEIYSTIYNIVKRSADENIPTYQIANKMAEERIEAIGKVKLPM